MESTAHMIEEFSEEKYKRQNDARTLADARVIQADKERLEAAKIGAQEITEEEVKRIVERKKDVVQSEARAKALMRIAKGKKA